MIRSAPISSSQPAQRVFLSHAHADKVQARQGYRALTGAGFEVFIDDLELRPRQDLRIELERHLDEAQWFVLLWSQSANREWVLWELKQALARAVTSGLRIVVVTLDCSERPEDIKNHLYIDLSASLRVGMAHLVAHLTDPAIRVIPVQPCNELYRPNVDDLGWYLTAARDHGHAATRSWKIVLGDAGLFSVLAQIYDIPPQASPAFIGDPPIEDVRRAYLKGVERLFTIGDVLGTALLQQLTTTDPYTAEPDILPLDACRRYLAWLMAGGFGRASKWLTNAEYDALNDSLRQRLQALWALLDTMSEKGLASYSGHDDPWDLLLGAEVPLDGDRFIWADLIVKPDQANDTGIEKVVLCLPSSHRVERWAERLVESEWPPPTRLLDDRTWALLFVPQIARELTNSLYTAGRAKLEPERLGVTFSRSAFARLGWH